MRRFNEVFREESGFRAFFGSIITFALSYGLYKGVIDNYLAEAVSMSGFDKGVSEFFRELPGLMLVFILAALYTFSAEKIYRIGAVIMMAGMAAQAVVPASRVLVIFCIFIYSLGDHIQLGMRNTLSLQYAKEGRGGEALGLQHAVYQIGTLAGYLVIIGVFFFRESSTGLFRSVFAASAGVIALGFLATLHMTGSSVPDETKRRFYFRKKYTKYYMLEVFYGARKQVFFTFGPFVLIRVYGMDTQHVAMLFAAAALFTALWGGRLIGRLVDRWGYRNVMIWDTVVLFFVCLLYGFAKDWFPSRVAVAVVCVNYVLDAVLSNASMATNLYARTLSDSQEELTATLSSGISVNHVVTVFYALLGGWIWDRFGPGVLFATAAFMALANSAFALTVPKPVQRS